MGFNIFRFRNNRHPASINLSRTDAQWHALSRAYADRRLTIHGLIDSGLLSSIEAARVFAAYTDAQTKMDHAVYADVHGIRAALAAESDLWCAVEEARNGATGIQWKATDTAQAHVYEQQQRWDNYGAPAGGARSLAPAPRPRTRPRQ